MHGLASYRTYSHLSIFGIFIFLQTANSTCFLLYEIAKQPELQERLIKEISSVVGDKKHPSWDDLQKITLVRNCVKEVMRLYVPTGGFPRVIAEDAVLLGYHVPAGVSSLLNLLCLYFDYILISYAFHSDYCYIQHKYHIKG